MTGRFITFEGGEGAGKSTQIKRLARRLREEGLAVVETREPGGTPAAEAIRERLLSGAVKQLGPEAEALMFAAARADHVDQLIGPAIDRGDWVLCDRFFDSTRVYQGMIGGVDSALLDALERVTVGRYRPELTLILDIAADAGLRRVRDRLEASGGHPDRFDSEDLYLHERRRAAFLEIAKNEPDRFVIIDASGDEQSAADAIWNAVRSRFAEEVA
ncbi:dTMP kinase [Bauldia sp.]|uniref:dTMP kinase n=1 Tax=Bauldia sp. TaxID=2575872 RepID=UPI003BAC90F3